MANKKNPILSSEEKVLTKHFSTRYNATFGTILRAGQEKPVQEKFCVQVVLPICHFTELLNFSAGLGWKFKHCFATTLVVQRGDYVTAFFHKG